ncbi:MAG: HAMP domain-containing protein [Desulfosalsimonadaceae bacterium]
MTVICEECGKIYHLDPDKLEQYRGRDIRVRCGECGHVTQLSSLTEPEEEDLSGPSVQEEEEQDLEQRLGQSLEQEMGSTDWGTDEGREEEAAGTSAPSSGSSGSFAAAAEPSAGRSSGLLGLRGKMMILFLLVPIVLIAATGYFSQMQINELADDITERSTDLVLEEGKEKIMQKARDVALQCEIYLRAHPDLKPQDFNYHPVFSSIAVQNVGETGYTDLIQEPHKDSDWTIWAHPNPNLVGIDDPSLLQKALGPYFPNFWKIITGAGGQKESEGFYKWKDPDGKIREKYAAITPVDIEGRPYLVMATAYIDEFTRKTENLKASAEEMAMQTRNINFGILVGAILLIGLCISIYGNRLAHNIQYLTEAAERISVGDLEAEIEVRSRDEIGSLADAISRMQDSLRYSIERLRRRR